MARLIDQINNPEFGAAMLGEGYESPPLDNYELGNNKKFIVSMSLHFSQIRDTRREVIALMEHLKERSGVTYMIGNRPRCLDEITEENFAAAKRDLPRNRFELLFGSLLTYANGDLILVSNEYKESDWETVFAPVILVGGVGRHSIYFFAHSLNPNYVPMFESFVKKLHPIENKRWRDIPATEEI